MRTSSTHRLAALLSGLIILTGSSSTERPAAPEQAGNQKEVDSPHGSGTQMSGTQVDDATADFDAGWNAGKNPNGVWRYGWSPGIAGTLTLFARNHLAQVNNYQERMWDDPNNSYGFTPSVARNGGGDYNDGNITFKGGALIMHPCGIYGTEYAHVIWTAPADGDYSLSASFFAQQNGINVDVHILVNGASVYDSTITSNGVSLAFARDFNLSAGSTIDFAVGPNGDFDLHPGNTGLDAKISYKETLSSPAEHERLRNGDQIALQVTPNPFTSGFTVSYNGESAPARIRIIDMMGRVVESRERIEPGEEIILGSELSTGAYFVEIIQRGERRGMLVHKVK